MAGIVTDDARCLSSAGLRPYAHGMRFDHVGLNVRDLESMAAWYCRAFGLERQLAFSLEAINLDIVMLLGANGTRFELLHRTIGSHRTATFANALVAAQHEGYGHCAFAVDDLDAFWVRVLELGAQAVMPPGDSPEPGVRFAWVHDPEGNLVELIEKA